jgi:hypothetical protein
MAVGASLDVPSAIASPSQNQISIGRPRRSRILAGPRRVACPRVMSKAVRREAAFTNCRVEALTGPHSMVVATK